MFLHLGTGLKRLEQGDDAENTHFDQLKELGLLGASATIFPYMTGLNAAWGGMKNMDPGEQMGSIMLKPTANASITQAKRNHTYSSVRKCVRMDFPLDSRPMPRADTASALTKADFPYTPEMREFPRSLEVDWPILRCCQSALPCVEIAVSTGET